MTGVPDTVVSSDEARRIAEKTFLFGLPLVYMSVQAEVATSVEHPEGGKAPLNQFANFRDLPDASDRLMVGLNVDTLYSLASLDLSSGPIVMSVPEMRNDVADATAGPLEQRSSHGVAHAGRRGRRTSHGRPGLDRPASSRAHRVRMPTNLSMIGGRTYAAGQDDYAAVHAIQDRYRLTPLSTWGTDYTPQPKVPMQPGVDAETPVPTQVLAMTPELLRTAERPVDRQPASLPTRCHGWRSPGWAWRPALGSTWTCFDPERAKGHRGGRGGRPAGGPRRTSPHGRIVNGWQIALDLGRYGTRYPYRAAWTFFAVGGNLIEDAATPWLSPTATATRSTAPTATGCTSPASRSPRERLLVAHHVRPRHLSGRQR